MVKLAVASSCIALALVLCGSARKDSEAQAAPLGAAKCERLVGKWVPRLKDTNGGKRHAVVEITKTGGNYVVNGKFQAINLNFPGFSYSDINRSCKLGELSSGVGGHGDIFYSVNGDGDTISYQNETWIRAK